MSNTQVSNNINTHKVSTIVSLALSIYANVRYFVGRSPSNKHNPWNVSNTPFSSNLIVTLVFWAILYVHQILFVSQVFVPVANSTSSRFTNRLEYTKQVAWHFTVFNLGTFFWTLLFVNKHFFWSEVVAILNYVNILTLYFSHKTFSIKPLSNWVIIHLPVTALPLSWTLYLIFWNGAVLFHVHKFVGRVISNILIWNLFFIPSYFLVAFGDYGVGLSSSVLTFGLGLGQLLTKVFALQWIFAFVISGLLFVGSLIVAVTGTTYSKDDGAILVDGNEQAPLLE